MENLEEKTNETKSSVMLEIDEKTREKFKRDNKVTLIVRDYIRKMARWRGASESLIYLY